MNFKKGAILGALMGLLVVFPLRAEDVSYQPIGPFGTLNNTDNSLVIPPNKAQDLNNVNISPGGASVFKRDGYAVAHTLTYTTSPVHGVHYFYDASGNDVAIAFHDKVLSGSVNGAAMSNVFTNGPNAATWQCVDSQGFAYCANTSRTQIAKTNGQTSSNLTGFTSTGSLVAVTPERLVQAGFSNNLSDIAFSKANDFATWTVGTQATDPISFTVTAPGGRITHIVYAFDRLMWFKETSFGYILIGNQPAFEDWQIVTVDATVGTVDNTSVYREGMLYFRGGDSHLYAFDGTNLRKITRDIQGTISQSQTRSLNSWTQTTQSDFEAGVSTPTGYASTTISPGSLVLSTETAIASFVDTSSANFAGGTLTNLSTTTIDGSLVLSLASEIVVSSSSLGSNSGSCSGCGPNSKLFLSTASANLSSAVLRLIKVGSPGNYAIRLLSDNSGVPGSLISSTTFSSSIVTTSTSNVSISMTSSRLISGTSYWIQIEAVGTCNASNYISWVGLGFVGSSSLNLCGGASGSTIFGMSILGIPYAASGNIVSRHFDVGFTTNTWIWNWSTFAASGTIPSLTTLTYQTQTSSSTNGIWESLVTVSSGSISTSTVQQFIRYKASFVTTDLSTSPILSEINIHMSPRIRPNATFYSQVHNAPNITAWDSFDGNKSGTHNFFIRTATNSFTILSSTPSWTPVTLGAVPSASTGTYIQVKDEFSTIIATANPSLNDFTVNWLEGNAADKSYAVYYRDAVWWSVVSGQGETLNNKILYYDMINDGMTLYDFPSNGFYVKNDSLYFGGSESGYVFKYGDVENDNGNAINAYWKSKDFVIGTPFQDKDFTNLSLAAKSVTSSSMTVTYVIDGSSSTAYTVPLGSSKSFIKSNRNLPLGRVGQTINVQFGNNATDQAFEVFGIQVGYRVKSWKPE